MLKSGPDELRISKSKNEYVFDEILIREYLKIRKETNQKRNNNFKIISFSENEENMLKFTTDYKKFLYERITESVRIKSKLFNAITIIKIYLNLKLYFEIKSFKNELEVFLEDNDEQTKPLICLSIEEHK